MKRGGRLVLVILALGIFLITTPALAQEDGGEATTTTSTTAGESIQPAVPITPEDETPANLDWTYRFLIPTALVLAVLVVLLTTIRYFTNVVRKRYRIVEE